MSDSMKPAYWMPDANSYKETFKSEITGTLTNLPNIAGTWGKFIPTGWGNYRISGYQVWSSQFYKITDTTTVRLVDNWQYLSPSNFMLGASGALVFPGNEVVQERVSIDVAYSFGYNGLGGTRRVKRIRFDQNPIFDIANGIDASTDFAFTVRYGNEDYPEPVMVARATDPEDVVYYPGQIVITFAGLESVYLGNKSTKSPLPTSIDIDVISVSGPQDTGIIGDPILRTFNANELDSSTSDLAVFRMANWKDEVLYEYNQYQNQPQKLKLYKLPSLEFIKEVPILTENDNGFYAFSFMHFHEPAGFIIAQTQGPFDGNHASAIYIIDPNTGEQINKFGVSGYTFSTPKGAGIPQLVSIRAIHQNENNCMFVGSTNQTSRQSYTFGMQKNGTAWAAYGDIAADILPERYANYGADGKEGVAYSNIGNDIYTMNQLNGFEFAFTVPEEDFNLSITYGFMAVVKTDLVLARGDKIIRYKKNGDKVYEKQYGVDVVPPGIWVSDPFNTPANIAALEHRRGQTDRVYGAYGSQHAYVLNLATGDMVLHPVTLGEGVPNLNVRGEVFLFDDVRGWAIDAKRNGTVSSGLINIPVTVEGERILLRDFLRSLYVNTGKYTADQIEFVDIEDTIVGALLVKPYPLDTIVNNTIRLYRIEKLETRDTIKFYRNRPIIGDTDIQYDIDLDELALVKDGEDSRASLITVIGDADKGYAEVKLTFIDYTADYNENSVVWRRPDAPADATSTLDISTIIIMDKNEAQQLVQILFQDKVSSTTKYKLILPPSYSDVYKGDILRVKSRNYSFVMRAVSTILNANHSVSIDADGAMLFANALPAIEDKPNFTVGAALGKGPTVVVPLDINAIHHSHNLPDAFAYYYLAYGTDPEWAGGYITRANDKMLEGRLFEVDKSIAFAAYTTANALTDKPWTLDEDTLDVTKIGGNWKPENNTTVTELAKNKAKNLCLYGAPGRWEIMQVAAIVDGKASGIFRGMRGTESFCGLHVPGDRLLVIDKFLVMEKRPLDNVGITDKVKAVSYSEKFDQASSTNYEVNAVSLKPFAPVNIQAETQENGDIVLTWMRRDRFSINSFEPIPMSEDSKLYAIDIIQNNLLERTITNVTDESFTYTVAMQDEDGIDLEEPLTLAVYQISAVVGRGYAGRATINV